jgi:signal peptidase I
MSLQRIPQPAVSRLSWIKELAAIFLIVFGVKTAIADTFYVPSSSMEPTLLIGDGFVASKFSYGYSTASIPFVTFPPSKRVFAALPQRGDVVVFRWPGDRSQTWVKRVIGLPGDRIAVRNGEVWINGEAATLRPDGEGEADIGNGTMQAARRFIETLPNRRSHAVFKIDRHGFADNFPEVVVPPDHVFVMGDNRDNSADSRFPVAAGGVGMLPVNLLVGRVEMIAGSWTPSSGLRTSRFLTRVN